MASWRDAASPEAQDDLDGLLAAALELAQQQLAKDGEFYPYALVVDADGQQRMIAADAGTDKPQSSDLITALVGILADQRAHLRGTAIVADIRLPSTGGDAVRVTLEHSEQVALTVLLPYKRRRFGRGVEYGDLQAGAGTRQVWPA